MTPKEKVEELINNLYELNCKFFKANTNEECANRYKLLMPICIESAIFAVDEILNLNFNIKCDATERCVNPVMDYWQEVKQEIENYKQ